jgi:hypothetical protein
MLSLRLTVGRGHEREYSGQPGRSLPLTLRFFLPLPLLLVSDSPSCLLKPMFTVGHSQLFAPLIVSMVYNLFFFSDHLIKIAHLFSGIYLCASTLLHGLRFAVLTAACHRWEFFTTLDFEWEVFCGRRPWKWSFVVYLTARILALIAIILNLIGFNFTSRFNCNVRSSCGVLLFCADEPYFCAGLVPFSSCYVMVLGGYRFVPSRASWVSDP